MSFPETESIFSLFPIFDMRQDRMMTLRDELGLDMKKFVLSDNEFNDLYSSNLSSPDKPESYKGESHSYRTVGDTASKNKVVNDTSYGHTASPADISAAEKPMRKKKTENYDQPEMQNICNKQDKTGPNKDINHGNDRKNNPQGQSKGQNPHPAEDFSLTGTLS